MSAEYPANKKKHILKRDLAHMNREFRAEYESVTGKKLSHMQAYELIARSSGYLNYGDMLAQLVGKNKFEAEISRNRLSSGSSDVIKATIIEDLDGILARCGSVLISGSTASGKTTLLNTIANRIPQGHRVIVVEEMSEMTTSHPNTLVLRPDENSEHHDAQVDLWDQLFTCFHRFAPKVLLVGELKVSNADNAFSLAELIGLIGTVHARSPVEAFSRIIMFLRSSKPDMELYDLIELAVSRFDRIVHVSCVDGYRRIECYVDPSDLREEVRKFISMKQNNI